MTTKRNREPHGAGRTRDKGQVKYYLAVCSLSGRKTAITMGSAERGAEEMKLTRSCTLSCLADIKRGDLPMNNPRIPLRNNTRDCVERNRAA
jgi:hypothetical protein